MEVLFSYVRTSPGKIVMFSRMISRFKTPVLITATNNEMNITHSKNVSM